MNSKRDKLREKLEILGVTRVREVIKSGMPFDVFHSDLIPGGIVFDLSEQLAIAEAWLEEKEFLEVKKDREIELAIANESNNIAKKANQIAWFAAGISALSLILSIIALRSG